MKRLLEIQANLKAPKNQFNDFWKYKYRSCEDILEALKPLLKEQWLVLFFEDSIEIHWDRFYVKSRAVLNDAETWKIVCYTEAYAREEDNKKWMDGSQITWSSSSYARKYALCWMFLIDDWIDSDTTNKGETKEEKKEKAWFKDPELDNFTKKASEYWTFEKWLAEIKKYYRISSEMEWKVKKLYENLETIKK